MTNYWQGQRVVLRQTKPEDWETHYRWNADAETWRNLDYIQFPRSAERTKARTEEMSKTEPVDDRFHMEIESIESGELLGSIGTNNTDRRNGTFKYGISVDPLFQRQGYASEAIGLVLKYYFDELRYQKCDVDIFSINVASIALHERLGFVKEGQIRRSHYTEGGYIDSCCYGLTDDEWRARESSIS